MQRRRELVLLLRREMLKSQPIDSDVEMLPLPLVSEDELGNVLRTITQVMATGAEKAYPPICKMPWQGSAQSHDLKNQAQLQ